MTLQRLDIYNVRNIQQQTLYPSPHFNFIFGDNASGKTALLEAIYLLGRAKSFRTPTIKSIIRFDQAYLTVTAQIVNQATLSSKVGIQMDGNSVEIRINQQSNRSRAELAQILPLQIIQPKSFDLLDAGSQVRREYLDWGLFNHDEHFLQVWRRYKKILLHRNSLLKLKTTKELRSWDKEFVNYGTMVNNYRDRYLASIKPFITKTTQLFLDLPELEIKLYPGWQTDRGFDDDLQAHLERDLRYGYSHCGSHRADIHVTFKTKPVKDVLSRGQLKILVICLKLAQVEFLKQEKNICGCLLLDDFSAELDHNNRDKLLEHLVTLNCQTFLTSSKKIDFYEQNIIKKYNLFHVEQGKFR